MRTKQGRASPQRPFDMDPSWQSIADTPKSSINVYDPTTAVSGSKACRPSIDEWQTRASNYGSVPFSECLLALQHLLSRDGDILHHKNDVYVVHKTEHQSVDSVAINNVTVASHLQETRHIDPLALYLA